MPNIHLCYTCCMWCCAADIGILLFWCCCSWLQVAYGACSVLTPDTGEAYGIIWTPSNPEDAVKLPLQKAPKPNCYWYKVGILPGGPQHCCLHISSCFGNCIGRLGSQ
jgi:hypothetical protein